MAGLPPTNSAVGAVSGLGVAEASPSSASMSAAISAERRARVATLRRGATRLRAGAEDGSPVTASGVGVRSGVASGMGEEGKRESKSVYARWAGVGENVRE